MRVLELLALEHAAPTGWVPHAAGQPSNTQHKAQQARVQMQNELKHASDAPPSNLKTRTLGAASMHMLPPVLTSAFNNHQGAS